MLIRPKETITVLVAIPCDLILISIVRFSNSFLTTTSDLVDSKRGELFDDLLNQNSNASRRKKLRNIYFDDFPE